MLEALIALRPALSQGLRRSGSLYIAPGPHGAVISETVAQQLIATGQARIDGDRLVLDQQQKKSTVGRS